MKLQYKLMSCLIIFFSLAACAPSASEKGPRPIPPPLLTIEADAEDIIDFAPSGNWERIRADISEITAAWNAYRPQARQDGAAPDTEDAVSSALARLQSAAASEDPTATMQASNDMSAGVVELFAIYESVIPADVGRLDVLERQVILDLAVGDHSAAEVSLARTKEIWRRVRPSVVEHSGEMTAVEFDASLEVQEAQLQGGNDSAVMDEARRALEIVDAIEQLY